ncbi:peptidase M24 [Compostibacillus humi]|uniref:Peptidase M24 n=1 Tax=Compostibacillus humi TaxID=1245525 RepID=A0A8J3EKR4_9BACI|nr:peptidoglycan DD-metalloendopeptidase family protein [Compostibacillus humi]GGH75483.1 peptidase M24 [Compostibacillus humi]
MKRYIPWIVIVMLAISMIAGPVTIHGESISELNKKINELEQQKKEIQKEKSQLESEKKDTEQKLKENQNQQQSVQSEINQLDKELTATQNQIQQKEKEITETANQIEKLKNQIEKLKKEIKDLEERIKKRDKLLKDRLRSIQQNGGDIKYMEVIFGAKSFGDFISRATAVTTIMNQDKDILEQQAADKQVLESHKTEVEAKKSEVEDRKVALENQKQELAGLKSKLDQQLAEKETLMAKLEEEEQHLEHYVISIEDEQKIISAQEKALEKAKALAQQELQELEQLAKQQNNNNSSEGNVAVSHSGGGNGMFAWPVANGKDLISSPFGQRWGKLHRGLDFAVPIGTPVYTAAPGVVIMTSVEGDGTMRGYGNVVLVAHSIGGRSYTTLYAHLSSIAVSSGQTVGRGQVIGHSGNTGDSTGPHLHFEIHAGGWNGDANAVNPRNYLP